ncbi:MAG TPA: SDR family oxidoreductase [Candidatus Kapabacteria bacterium]|nr:SDR family oxidoreductase [Candidatus Kapabacteria bacterium]
MPLSKGQIAWLTGGTSGIGLEIARALVAHGIRVAVTGRDQTKLDSTASELGVLAVPCDMSNEKDVRSAYARIVSEMGPVDILVNNAGISPFTKFSETSIEEFDEVIDINLTGYFLAVREVLPSMYERKQGAVVQMLSIASTKAFAGGAAYIASKFGALGLTNSLREEARKHNVKVIAILPGATETPLWGVEEREKFHERMMQPEDIALTVVQLLDQPDRMLTEEIVLRPIGGDL